MQQMASAFAVAFDTGSANVSRDEALAQAKQRFDRN